MRIDTPRGSLPIKYDWMALAEFGDQTKKSLDEILTVNIGKMQVREVMTFILIGLKTGAKAVGEECKVDTIEDIADMMNKDVDLINKAMLAVTEMGKAGKEESKKK